MYAFLLGWSLSSYSVCFGVLWTVAEWHKSSPNGLLSLCHLWVAHTAWTVLCVTEVPWWVSSLVAWMIVPFSLLYSLIWFIYSIAWFLIQKVSRQQLLDTNLLSRNWRCCKWGRQQHFKLFLELAKLSLWRITCLEGIISPWGTLLKWQGPLRTLFGVAGFLSLSYSNEHFHGGRIIGVLSHNIPFESLVLRINVPEDKHPNVSVLPSLDYWFKHWS